MRRVILALVVLIITGRAQAQESVRPHVEVAAARFGLSVELVEAVISAESAGRPRAVSSAGAMGLMQLMPGTWAILRDRLGLGEDPFDPADNILAGAAYLRELHDRYGAPGFLAAYNAGPGRYEASLAGRPLPAETRLYVARILDQPRALAVGLMDQRSLGLFPTAWSPALGASSPQALAGPASTGARALFVPRQADQR